MMTYRGPAPQHADPGPAVEVTRTQPARFEYQYEHRGHAITQRYWVWVVRAAGETRVAIDFNEKPDLFKPSRMMMVEEARALRDACALGLDMAGRP